jgi:hypothetical protein
MINLTFENRNSGNWIKFQKFNFITIVLDMNILEALTSDEDSGMLLLTQISSKYFQGNVQKEVIIKERIL